MTTSPVATGAPPLIVADRLVKSYGPTHALVGVSLTIAAGSSVAIMGPSGSGKTTLLHCLSGILPVTSGAIGLQLPSGQIRLETLDAAGRARLRREHLGFVFQQGMLVPELTAVENVALPLMLNGVPRAAAERQAEEWLVALGLPGLGERRIGQLSGGQAQRVAIARAQAIDPALVFADEPTGALDSATSVDVMTALLHSVTGRGRTLVVVTHDNNVARCCSRILTLADGRI
ncbi:MAG: ABC transporter ATP-binding protein, partial [Acidipropionibacterium jensenii]|nr:ABC transporter ATP-binding protein [Acidipropionibacterium jensenii]